MTCWLTRLSFGAALLCLLLASEVRAQRDLKEIPPVDPELERATFVLPEGFEVNLFAADPKIAKPIQMNFDPQGRLWLVSSEVYPHIVPGAEATDKVLVLEDKDGDGVSDATHVFADGLLIPTGIAPGDGGCYVGASTELLHFVDDDGDLKADRTQVVLSGFGTEDTHHIVHTLRWGPEQRLYFSQSIYIHSHIETPWGVRRLNAGGIWQFRPDTLKLEVFAKGLVNSWGTDFNQAGATFATDGAGGEGINYMVPGAYYTTAFGAPRILQGLNPGSPKHCGLEIAYSEHLPEDWAGNGLTNDFRGHRVCRFTLREEGSGFSSQEQQEVIKSDHPAFRPVDVKLGPDGAIYIADWYNPIIQHGEVDFRDPRRDHTHGRIWRVTYTGKPLVERPKLVDVSTESLLKHLESPNVWTRRQAQRVLKERGPNVLTAARHWARSLDNTHPKFHHWRLEALWLHLAHDVVDAELLESLLVSKDAGIRAAATRVIGDWHDRLPQALDLLAARVADDAPRVRLEAVRALALIRQPESIEIAARALDPPTERVYQFEIEGQRKPAAPDDFAWDEWLDYALWLTSRELQPIWEPALLAGKIDFDGNAKHTAFVLKSAGSPATVPALLKLLSAGEVAEADRADVLDAIAAFGRPEDLQGVLQLSVDATDDVVRHGYLQSLVEAFRLRKARPAGPFDSWLVKVTTADKTVQATAARLIGLWRIEQGRDWLARTAADKSQPVEVRQFAIDGLADFGGDQAAKELVQLTTGDAASKIRQRAITALLGLKPHEAAKRAAEFLRSVKDPAIAVPVLEAFTSRPNAADVLAGALDLGGENATPIAADVAVLGLRTIRASGRRYPQLEAALAKAGGISSEAVPMTPEQLAQLATQVQEHGDAGRGELIFRRQDLACLKCHAVGDAGGVVGPNLLSLGATAQVDYLLQSLLDPNAKVKEGYHTAVIIDNDGRQWAGIKLRQTDTAVILRDADGIEREIPLNSIDLEQPGISLMPAGLTEKLTQPELADLTAFLSALGRLPDYTLGQQQLARRWQVMEATPAAANQLRRVSYAHATTDDEAFQWRTVFSTVAGSLPVADLPEVGVKNRVASGTRGVSFARCEIEVSQPGDLLLAIGSTAGLQMWVDEQPVELQPAIPLNLPVGKHRLTLAIDRSDREQPLRLELKQPEGSTAVARFVGGP
ncbi:MAG: PVC-type heme-binding CxxCH protein [Planctomycetaceae bacterium]